ncbi:MAG: NAD-dependent epimerase/dehydratase family protein [Vulcanimicrobiota bacterium]
MAFIIPVDSRDFFLQRGNPVSKPNLDRHELPKAEGVFPFSIKEARMNVVSEIVQRDLGEISQNAERELETLAGKKVLLTGGAGFLGYYLVKAILHFNQKVPRQDAIQLHVWDNFIRGIPSWLNSHKEDANLTLVERNIIEPLSSHVADFSFIIHAASIASPTYYRKFPIETMDANVTGLRNLLDFCLARKSHKTPVEGLLFFSSSEIYGDPEPEHIPTPEHYWGRVSCTGPRACYDESKRFGETLCVNFAHQHGLPIKIARPFNNYGPGLKITDRRVLPDFARNIVQNEDIVILSDGSPTRTFCYVSDAIVGYLKVLVRGGDGEAYNIGTERPEVSIADLAHKLVALGRELCSYTGTVRFGTSDDRQYLIDNPNRRCPVIAKAREQLGYSPQVDIDDGLRRTLLWYLENLEATEA